MTRLCLLEMEHTECSMLIRPRYLVLDTAHVVGLVDDYFSLEELFRKRARDYVRALSDSGILLTFADHHFVEMFQHADDNLVKSRLQFIRSLDPVAWVAPIDEHGIVGAVKDVLAREILALQSEPTRAAIDIRNAVRTNVFQIGNGSQLVSSFIRDFREFSEKVRSDQQRPMEIAAVVHSTRMTPARMTVGEFLELPRPSSTSIPQNLSPRREEFSTELISKSDRRLANPQSVAIEFMENVADGVEFGMQASHSTYEFMKVVLAQVGVDVDTIARDMLLCDLCQLVVDRHKVRVSMNLLERAGLNPEFPSSLSGLPSLIAERALLRHRQDYDERPGSEITDRHMVALGLYGDWVFVDKRTLENTRRAARSDEQFRLLATPVLRAPRYLDTLRNLGIDSV